MPNTSATAKDILHFVLNDVLVIFILIFGGCCSNVVFLEYLTSAHPKSGTLITFSQYLLVIVEGLFSNIEWPILTSPKSVTKSGSSGKSRSGSGVRRSTRTTSSNLSDTTLTPPSSAPHTPPSETSTTTPESSRTRRRRHRNTPSSPSTTNSTLSRFIPRLKPRVIPLSRWTVMVLLFFISSVLNNFALGYNISMPFHIIFRSASLIVSMLLGFIILKKRYNIKEVAGVVLVTFGVILSTISSAKQNSSASIESLWSFLIGIGCLTVALILSSFLGLYQQLTYQKYGKQWREGLFYTHFLGLPFFLLFSSSIWSELQHYASSPSTHITIPFISTISLPSSYLYLLLNIFTQYLCISGVHKLSSVTTSVTLNLVLSVRKFLSLVVSIVWFDNSWSVWHSLGAAGVFGGTIVYTLGNMRTNGAVTGTPRKVKVQ